MISVDEYAEAEFQHLEQLSRKQLKQPEEPITVIGTACLQYIKGCTNNIGRKLRKHNVTFDVPQTTGYSCQVSGSFSKVTFGVTF
ncbi:hypothetical protein Trydic_g14860 [Trypoxylus dichotomus]